MKHGGQMLGVPPSGGQTSENQRAWDRLGCALIRMSRRLKPGLRTDVLLAVLITIFAACLFAQTQNATNEAPLDSFAREQREANWPALFKKVGDEFGVPADVLAGISLIQTRWFHFEYPTNDPGSCNGMPRPYGIMGLWDDDTNGHNLAEAAKLVGKTSQDLKVDPEQNVRGAAALLKKFYQEDPIPNGTTTGDIESWRNAIAKFSGKPEAEAQSHAVGIYEAINEGDHELGIDWPGHPINLEPMREAVKKLVDADRRLHPPPTATSELAANPFPATSPLGPRPAQIKKFRALQATPSSRHAVTRVEQVNWTIPVISALAAVGLLLVLLVARRR
jgi:hypothetical protein